MPQTAVLVFQEANGDVPLTEWLEGLSTKEPKAHAKCLERIVRLSQLGSELRMPLSRSLGDGIFELRAKIGTVNYRMLYFFHGKSAAVISHGLTKEDKLPPNHLKRAKDRKELIEKDAVKHTADFKL